VAVQSARITVSTSAVALDALETDAVAGTKVVVTNQDATNSVDLGDASVAAGAGYELKAGKTVQIDLPKGEQLYAIRTGGADVRVDVLRAGA
jgi:hypothetical protein